MAEREGFEPTVFLKALFYTFHTVTDTQHWINTGREHLILIKD